MDIILPDNVGILPLSPSSRKNPDGPHLLKRRAGRDDSAAVLLIGSQMVAASSTCQCGLWREAGRVPPRAHEERVERRRHSAKHLWPRLIHQSPLPAMARAVEEQPRASTATTYRCNSAESAEKSRAPVQYGRFTATDASQESSQIRAVHLSKAAHRRRISQHADVESDACGVVSFRQKLAYHVG